MTATGGGVSEPRGGSYPPGPQVVQQVVADLGLFLVQLREKVQKQREAAVVLLHLAQVSGRGRWEERTELDAGQTLLGSFCGGVGCPCPLHTPSFWKGVPGPEDRGTRLLAGGKMEQQCLRRLGPYLNIR